MSTGVRWHDDDRIILGCLIEFLQRIDGTANTTLIGALRKSIRIAAEHYGVLPEQFKSAFFTKRRRGTGTPMRDRPKKRKTAPRKRKTA